LTTLKIFSSSAYKYNFELASCDAQFLHIIQEDRLYIVPSEQERTRSEFCQNWVFDCIMLYMSRSIREKNPRVEICTFIPYFERWHLHQILSALSFGARRHYLELMRLRLQWLD